MAVPSTITDLNVTAASNSPAGSEAVGTSMDDFLRAIQAIVRRRNAQGAGIASASTVNLGSNTDGDYVHITGTTTITSFGTVASGVSRVVVFDGALTLTHNATSLILPSGANITTAAGDAAEFVSEGSGNWRCVRYLKADGSPVAVSISSLSGVYTYLSHGQCRLAKSGANLLLSPFNGNKLIINGTPCAIPAAGVTLAPPATSGTTYYIYAYMSGAMMTLEASATGHVTDTPTGIEVKSGDSTRTLVGMARTFSSAWVDTVTARFVLSYFNRRTIQGQLVIGGSRTTTSATFAELSSADRVEFLSWADEAVSTKYSTSASNSNTGTTVSSAICIDGTVVTGSACRFTQAGAGGNEYPVAGGGDSAVSEGYHYASLMGAVSANTGTWTSVGGINFKIQG